MENSRPSFDSVYLETVQTIAKRSTCLFKKVGAVIVVDNRIISHGYNGVVSGDPNCCDTAVCQKEVVHDENFKVCVHAEQNAICLCAKRGLSLEGGTLYVNADPCITCAKLIVSCGIKRVVIERDADGDGYGVDFLIKHGVEVEGVF